MPPTQATIQTTSHNENAGHFFIKYGKGRRPFKCTNMHSEDTKKSLNVLNEWIREIIENGTSVNQDILLTELSPILAGTIQGSVENMVIHH